ncbi:MAG: FAD-dependent oxidoreductase [Rhodothalassiaceae bacterium]
MGDAVRLTVAIVGSGPAGYYAAEALSDMGESVAIDILDRLPTPFGLIRAGVAPDHQSIKQVARRYEKTALRANVRFVGNVSVGSDVTVAELLDLYDAVILATGATGDRRLDIPGETLDGMWGSSAFVGWYNSHPDYADLDIRLDVASVAVIGNGNVAIDIARILAKTADEMANTDLAEHAAARIHGSPLRDIHIIGRRGPLEASFTPKELGEMGELERAVSLVSAHDLPPEEGDAALDPGKRKVLSVLRRFATNRAGDKPVRIHFRFYARPVAVLGHKQVCGLRLEHTRVENGRAIGTGEMFDLPCGLVVSAIGYRTSAMAGVPFDERRGLFPNEGGRIRPRLYTTGWARRGPSGTIGTNRPDALEVARRICEEIVPAGREGRAGLDRLLLARGVDIVTFRDWQRIDEAEIRAARNGQPRLKFLRREDMLRARETPSASDRDQRDRSERG